MVCFPPFLLIDSSSHTLFVDAIGGHAAHGLESNRQLDPDTPASSENPERIERFPADLESNASYSKKHSHAHVHELGVVELVAA